MKFAVISDIHGNIEALDAVIADAEARGVRQLLCLGDIVGYGPDPAECVRRIQALNCPTVRGNHDHYAADDSAVSNWNELAEYSLMWTRNQLTEVQRNWLGALPYSKRVGRFAISHATPHRPNLWSYVRGLDEAHDCLVEQVASLCFIGHTHVPVTFRYQDGMTSELTGNHQALLEGTKALVNVGSVGQPRDGDWRASYAIYDSDEAMIEYRRVEYAVAETQSRLLLHGFPESFAARLTSAA